MPSNFLARILGEVRRRLLWIGGITGLGWGLVGAVICLLLGVWLDLVFEFSPIVRIGALVVALLTALGALGWIVFRVLLQSRADDIARRLDEVAGTGGQIRCGVDLAQTPVHASASHSPALTQGMAEMAIARAVDLARSVSRRSAVSARPIGRSFGTFAGFAALIVLLVLSLPRVALTQWLRFTDPYGDHPPYSGVQFSVDPEGARVPFGSGQDIHVTVAGQPVDRLDLVLVPVNEHQPVDRAQRSSASENADRETLPMFPTSGGRWRASVTNVTTSMTYFVQSHQSRSHQYRLGVITVPKIEEVRYRVTSPAYTRQPVYEGGLPRNGLAGLPGTVVEVSARSNRPLSGGTLTFIGKEGELPFPMQPAAEGADSAVGKFTIERPGRVEVRVTDVDGQPSTDSVSAPVVVLADERPFVRLMEPQPMSLAVPNASLPVVISGEDDYGIAHCQLFRSLNDSPYMAVDVPTASPPSRRMYEMIRLPLGEYGLSPGDQIKLFARVVDNDPAVAGGKGSESTIAVVQIISQEDLERMQRARDGLTMLTAKYQEVQRRMEALAEEAKKLEKELAEKPADSPMSDELQKKMEELGKRIQSESEALQKLSEQKLPYELDKELNPKLEQLAKDLQRLVKDGSGLGGKKPKSKEDAEKELKELLAALQQERQELDTEIMQPVELVAQVLPLMQDQGRFIEIYRRQRDLADRLASLKDKNGGDDPALKVRMRDLEEEQDKLSKDLVQLLDDIENHAAQLPEDSRLEELRRTSLEFAAGVRGSGAPEEIDGAKTALGEFAGTRAHEHAKRAADILEEFISKCQGMGEQAGQCLPKFQPKLGQCLGQTCDQLLADMGLGTGTGNQSGFGMGNGSGYSASRSTLQNVGLYGNMPLLSTSSANAKSGSDRAMPGGRERGAAARGDDGTAFNAPQSGNRSTATETSVPPVYRQRVGRYFQRIADEVGDK